MKLGIVGLPNVGKSTLFNAITSTKNAAAANYPFCTIEPNTGIVSVPDARLDKLAARGLVAREKDPRDGRAVRVRLLEAGISRVDGAMEGLLRAEREVLAGLTDGERAQLADALRTLMEPFEPSDPPPGS